MAESAQVDALTDRSPEGVLWTRVNSAEATPGVLTPMTWTFYGHTLEVYCRHGFADVGVIARKDVTYPPSPGDRLLGIFYGRLTVNVDVARGFLSALPGVTGDDVERDMLGAVREGMQDETPSRALQVLTKAPWYLTTSKRRPGVVLRDNREWWGRNVGRDGIRPGVQPLVLLHEAVERYGEAIRMQAWVRMFFGGATAQLTALAERAGQPEAASSLLAGAAGTDEAEIADDLWELAGGRLDLGTFISRHGFHGPNAGELSARSWREDAGSLERLLGAVRESEAPAQRRARVAAERAQVIARVLRALPARERPAARALLRIAPLTTRTLERTKASMLISGDGGRAATRAIGEQFVRAGLLDSPDDAFHFFARELLAPTRLDWRAVASERKELRARCEAVELPETWIGQPQPVPRVEPELRDDVTRVTGLGASPGVAEGRVRVVLDPADEVDVEPGDVLVCPTTDPSWLALMAVASALVIDIGAAASHGAIVARELGVPCVIGTRHGTLALRDGDRVRVDGSAGVAELLERAI